MEMNKSIAIKMAALIAAGGLAMMSSAAFADSRVHWSVNVGIPQPPVVYYSAPPAYVQPQPVYVQPQPVYVAPPPVVEYAPVYYYDAYGRPYYYRPHHRHHHGYR
jgi:hypothetical protein